ncbi:MAG: hypothetical protein MJ014_07830, partial [Methanocorpusculum sp.]|nr:hypothetical protein [Methanocorpusculum sp.]
MGADAAHHVRILVIRMNPDAEFLLPGVSESLSRSLYFYEGDEITVGGNWVAPYHRIRFAGDAGVTIKAGNGRRFLLLLSENRVRRLVVECAGSSP